MSRTTSTAAGVSSWIKQVRLRREHTLSESRFTEALARFVAAHDPLSLPGPVRVSARQAMADCMGCALAGVGDPAAEIVRKAALDEPGGCTVWGTALRATARNAALVNGTAAHALALDDTNESMRGHPSAPIVPAVFAVGEEIDASGESLVAAYAVGVEVAAKLGRAVNDTHSERGWHTTMTLGTVGAACAVAHLLKLDVIETRHAIGIAATMAVYGEQPQT